MLYPLLPRAFPWAVSLLAFQAVIGKSLYFSFTGEGFGSPFSNLKTKNNMTKFKCPCKYTYDPEKGDPKQDIPPGTPFEELPDTWRCPRCKRKKEKFVPVKE